MQVPASDFYGEYHGHRVEHLEVVERHLRSQNKGQIFLVGDSSLDNKFWFNNRCVPKNGYEDILSPPGARGKPDIAHCLNKECVRRRLPLSAINCSVEESRVESRA